jgi:hypothetical protein
VFLNVDNAEAYKHSMMLMMLKISIMAELHPQVDMCPAGDLYVATEPGHV